MGLPDNKFTFNPKAPGDAYIGAMRKELEEIAQAIETLEREIVISRVPLFSQLIRFFPADVDPKEIKQLGKALIKYAEFYPIQKELSKKVGAIDIAKQNPDLFALAFGDGSDISGGFEEFLADNLTDEI